MHNGNTFRALVCTDSHHGPGLEPSVQEQLIFVMKVRGQVAIRHTLCFQPSRVVSMPSCCCCHSNVAALPLLFAATLLLQIGLPFHIVDMR